jgi:hypothetical protein
MHFPNEKFFIKSTETENGQQKANIGQGHLGV